MEKATRYLNSLDSQENSVPDSDISLASAYTARRMLIGLVVHRGVRDVTALSE